MSLDPKKNGIADPRELAARLRQRITFERSVETTDGAGGVSRSFTEVATVWAEIIPQTPSISDEKYLYGQMQSSITHRILLRYRNDITTAMRVRYAGRCFNLRVMINVGEADMLLELLAEEGVAS